MTNKPHPARGYLFIAAATFFWGFSATDGPRSVYRQALRRRPSPTPDRPSHPGPEPNHNCVADTAADLAAEGEIVPAGAESQPSAAVLSAGDSRTCSLQLLLLFRHPEDERCDGDCPAICRTGMGAAVHAGAPAPASDDAARQRCGPGCAWLRTGGGRTGGAARISLARDLRDSLQYARRRGGGTGSDLVRLLQRLRSTLAADLPALDGAGVFAAGCGCFLADWSIRLGKSSLSITAEDSGCSWPSSPSRPCWFRSRSTSPDCSISIPRALS